MRRLCAALCTLEPQVEAHATEMFEVLSDPAIYQFEGEAPPSLEALAAGFARKEGRRSPDGTEIWLNWVVRQPSGEAAGYVQATVMPGGHAYVGYEFASRFWRRGIATDALATVFAELASAYGVQRLVALLKSANYRSLALLRKLGFAEAARDEWARYEPEPDELVMLRAAAPPGAT
jgi:[ribosomal protein S5]-alanine N-acetyltransferase